MEQISILKFIQFAIDAYMSDINTDKSLMKYSEYPEAYDLRPCEQEEDKYNRNYSEDKILISIDRNTSMSDLMMNVYCLVEIENFIPPDFDEHIESKLGYLTNKGQ